MMNLSFVAVSRPEVRRTEVDLCEMKFDLSKGIDTVSSSENRICLACKLLNDAFQEIEGPRFADAVSTLSRKEAGSAPSTCRSFRELAFTMAMLEAVRAYLSAQSQCGIAQVRIYDLK